MNNKEKFQDWLSERFPTKTGAKSSYLRAIELLIENTGIIIFEENRLEKIIDLYNDVLKEQGVKDGKYFNQKAPSYGYSRFYSAALKSYIDFLRNSNPNIESQIYLKELLNNQFPFHYKTFHQASISANLKFSEKLVARFVASLCTKPFVICSGLSGSGKTKLAQSFVQWICESKNQYKIVAVGADWTNREPLLGYPNALDAASYVNPDNGVLDLLLNAIDNEHLPHFLILDEMNLSHVERYFADFLSAMESKEPILLHGDKERKDSNGQDIPKEITLPENLFLIGTVNIDETTYMFSPKVLDRANAIEFRISAQEMESYLTAPKALVMNQLIDSETEMGKGASMATSFLEIANEDNDSTINIKDTLVLFFTELRKTGAEFGYRGASEINRLVSILESLTKSDQKWDENDITEDDFMDIAIIQKLLPKLHGSRSKLSKILPILAGFCLIKDGDKVKENYLDKSDTIDFLKDTHIKYKLSFEKICRMYKNAIENGYASYAEA